MIKKVVDMFLLYQITKRLATPFKNWNAYKTGLIDDKGNFIVDEKDRTKEQRNSLTYLDTLILNIKKTMGKIPGGSSRAAALGVVLYNVREEEGAVPTTNMGSDHIAIDRSNDNLLGKNRLARRKKVR